MTSSSSAPAAPVQRSGPSSPEPGRRSCFWTRADCRAIKFCRRIPSIRQEWTSSTSVGVGAAVRAAAPPTHIVRLRRTAPPSTSSFGAGRAGAVRVEAARRSLQDAAASAGVGFSTRHGSASLVRDGVGWWACEPLGPGGRSAVLGAARCRSRRPAFHGRTPGRGGGVARHTMPRARCSGVLERSRVLAHRIRPIDSGCTSRIRADTSA